MRLTIEVEEPSLVAALVHGWHHGRTICRGCDLDVTRVGIIDLAYTFEVCECAEHDYPHLAERIWHRACLRSPDEFRAAMEILPSTPEPEAVDDQPSSGDERLTAAKDESIVPDSTTVIEPSASPDEDFSDLPPFIIDKRRQFTDDQKARVVAYAEMHGTDRTADKLSISPTVIRRWRQADAVTRTTRTIEAGDSLVVKTGTDVTTISSPTMMFKRATRGDLGELNRLREARGMTPLPVSDDEDSSERVPWSEHPREQRVAASGVGPTLPCPYCRARLPVPAEHVSDRHARFGLLTDHLLYNCDKVPKKVKEAIK